MNLHDDQIELSLNPLPHSAHGNHGTSSLAVHLPGLLQHQFLSQPPVELLLVTLLLHDAHRLGLSGRRHLRGGAGGVHRLRAACLVL